MLGTAENVQNPRPDETDLSGTGLTPEAALAAAREYLIEARTLNAQTRQLVETKRYYTHMCMMACTLAVLTVGGVAVAPFVKGHRHSAVAPHRLKIDANERGAQNRTSEIPDELPPLPEKIEKPDTMPVHTEPKAPFRFYPDEMVMSHSRLAELPA